MGGGGGGGGRETRGSRVGKGPPLSTRRSPIFLTTIFDKILVLWPRRLIELGNCSTERRTAETAGHGRVGEAGAGKYKKDREVYLMAYMKISTNSAQLLPGWCGVQR